MSPAQYTIDWIAIYLNHTVLMHTHSGAHAHVCMIKVGKCNVGEVCDEQFFAMRRSHRFRLDSLRVK